MGGKLSGCRQCSVPALVDILKIVVKHNLVLVNGHLSSKETL